MTELMQTKDMKWLDARHAVRNVPELDKETDDALVAVGAPHDVAALAAVGGPILDAITNVMKWIGEHGDLILAAGKFLAMIAALFV